MIEGTIRGKTIELETDPGLADGQAVQVIVQPLPTLAQQRETIRRTAGALSHKPSGYFKDLEEIIRERRESPDRGISE